MIAILIIFLLTFFPLSMHSCAEKAPASNANVLTADLIVYSYDRPLQLYAFLESAYAYITGLETITVIYRASTDEYAQAYTTVHNDFKKTFFLKQGATPQQDFKPLTLEALNSTAAKYVLFAVDDIVVTDYIDLTECIALTKQTKAYGFYLRLGTQLTNCYSYNCKQELPPLEPINSNVYKWQFSSGTYDWGYPNTVDMTLYKKSTIKSLLHSMHYCSPNSLEGCWASHTHNIRNRFGLCYAYSKIVNLPLNKVQNEWNNRHMNEWSPQQLLDLFNKNLKLDIKPLFQVLNPSAHMEYNPTFVTR